MDKTLEFPGSDQGNQTVAVVGSVSRTMIQSGTAVGQ